jgi:hypothetical protein
MTKQYNIKAQTCIGKAQHIKKRDNTTTLPIIFTKIIITPILKLSTVHFFVFQNTHTAL